MWRDACVCGVGGHVDVWVSCVGVRVLCGCGGSGACVNVGLFGWFSRGSVRVLV